MKRKNDSLAGVLQPYSMEYKSTYIERFANHQGMRSLFGDTTQCVQIAEAAFRAKWETALVTVRKLDGSEFFID